MQEPGSDDPQPLADLYEFDYRDNLTKRFNERNPLFKALVMMGVIFAVWPRFMLSLIRKGKGLKDKLQVLTLGGIMVAMVAYMVIMISAAVTTVAQVPAIRDVSNFAGSLFVSQELRDGGANQGTENSDKQQSDKGNAGDSSLAPGDTADGNGGARGNEVKNGEEGSGSNSATAQGNNKSKVKKSRKSGAKINLFQALVVVFAALGLFQKKSLKEVVSTIATEYVSASNYLRMANQKPAILGQAAALLKHIAEQKEITVGFMLWLTALAHLSRSTPCFHTSSPVPGLAR